jgi:hypothetical protein
VERKERKSRFEIIESFRMFKEEWLKIDKIVRHAKDFDGGRKYTNRSHFYRCAVIRAMREELRELDVKRGRPRKG